MLRSTAFAVQAICDRCKLCPESCPLSTGTLEPVAGCRMPVGRGLELSELLPPVRPMILDASTDDMKWVPPDYATSLVGRSATWNGEQLEVESACPKEHVGSVVVLKPARQRLQLRKTHKPLPAG